MRSGLMQPSGKGQEVQTAPAEPTLATEYEDDEDDSEYEDASPEEQAQYDELMSAFRGAIHSPQTRDKILAQLKQGRDNPGKKIGEMALTIYEAVEAQVMQAKGEIMDSVRQETMADLVMELVEVAVAAGIVPESEEAIGVTTAAALDVFASAYGNSLRQKGIVNPDVAKQLLEGYREEAVSKFVVPPSQRKPIAESVGRAQKEGAA